MQYEPPRAAKKYSQTFEFNVNRIHHRLLSWVPGFLKPEHNFVTAPLAAASLSLVPGLGSFYLNQKLWWPLFQFGAWVILFVIYLFTFGTFTGFMVAMSLFSFHQYLMYNSYLQGLRLNGIPVPGFWRGMRLSILMAAILGVFYLMAYGPLGDHLFYAQGSLGTTVQQGDRFFVTSSDQYVPGQVILFSRDQYERHSSSGQASILERILATEGDNVQIADGMIFVNAQPLGEKDGPLEKVSLPNTQFTVPKDCFFLAYPIWTNLQFRPEWFLINKNSVKGSLAFKYFPQMEVLP